MAMFNRLTRFKFWVQWVLINAFSLTLCFAITGIIKELDTESHSYFAINSPNTIDCIISGLVLGVAQWLTLKRLIPNLSPKWILASSIALPISVCISLATDEFLVWMYFFNHPSSIRHSMKVLTGVGFTGGVVGGTISGLIQRAVLKQQVRSVDSIVLLAVNMIGSAIGWAIAWATAFYAGYIAINFYQTDNQVIELSVLGIVFGLVNGAIAGGGLVWILQRWRRGRARTQNAER